MGIIKGQGTSIMHDDYKCFREFQRCVESTKH